MQRVSRASASIHVVKTWFALLLEMDSIAVITRARQAQSKQCERPKKGQSTFTFRNKQAQASLKLIETSARLQVHMWLD